MEFDCNRTVDDNLTSLVELDEKTLLENVRRRYLTGRVYTDVGDILLAVNPFKQLPIYTDEWSELYSTSTVDDKAPHIFGVATKAFTALLQTKKDQVCVISGESGAGKTESTKLIIQQLMKMCRSSHIGTQLQQRILQLNPVLEAFGNAKTVLNNNSSRFGKFIQLMFTSNGRIVGGGLDQYLLEKSRVCFQGEGELNYHIFYYLLDGIDSTMAKELQINKETSYQYICSTKGTASNSSSSKVAAENKFRLDEVTCSMKDIGFTSEEIAQVFTILAAILHLGDIVFETTDSSNDGSRVVNKDKVDVISELLKLEYPEDLCFALTTLRTTTRGETVDKLYSPSKAADVRDGLSKALYSRMFQWLVSRINNYIAPHDPSGSYIGIGILDIFGFEIFKKNSFEQFCINVANEQLQQYFNTQIFAMEKEEYVKEGISGVDISYQDNQPVLQLFLSRPMGLMSLLDEQCRTNGNESRLLERYRQSFNKHPDYKPDRGNALIFTVQHYAGKVEYFADGFIDKNRDSLPDPVQGVMKFSGHRLVRNLFTHYPNISGSVLRSTSILKPSQRSILKKMSVRKKKSTRHKRGSRGGRAVGGGRRKVMTVGGHFRESLQKLMERILSATPHFVRCFKPNPLKVPFEFDNDFVAKQLKYTGMLEAIRVRREGFAYRPFFSDFVNDYKSIAFKMTDKTILHSSQDICEKILHTAGITGWKIGKSRVFLRYFHEEKLNRMLLEMETKAIKIQSLYRGYYTRKRFKPLFEMANRDQALVDALLKDIHQHSEDEYLMSQVQTQVEQTLVNVLSSSNVYIDSFSRIVELNKTDILMAIERFGHPNQGCEDIDEELESEPMVGKRNFEPKAVGGVAILLDVKLPLDVSSKGVRSFEKARDKELVTAAEKQKPSPPVQPRKLNMESIEDNLSGKSRQKEKQNNFSKPTAHTLANKIITKEVRPVPADNHLSKHEVSKGSPSNSPNSTPIYAKPIKKKPPKKAPPPISPKPKPKKKLLSNFVNTKTAKPIANVKSPRNSPDAKENAKRAMLKPIIKRESSSDCDYIDMSGDFSTLDLPFKRRPDSSQTASSGTGHKLTPSLLDKPSQEYGQTFANDSKGMESIYSEYAYITLINDATIKPKAYMIQTSPEQSVISDTDVQYMEILPHSLSKASDEEPSDHDDYVLPTRRLTNDTDDLQASKHHDDDYDDDDYALPCIPTRRLTNDSNNSQASRHDDDEEDDDGYVLPHIPTRRLTNDTDNSQSGDISSCRTSSSDDLVRFYKQKSNSFDSKLLHRIRIESPDLPQERCSSVVDKPNNGGATVVYPGPSNSFTNSRQRWLSSSVPDLLSVGITTDHKPSNGEKGLTIETPLLHRLSMASNDSTSSSTSSSTNVKQKKKKLGNIFKKKKAKQTTDQAKLPVSASSDLGELPGYFPGISKQDAIKMLGGKSPQGVYIIYTDYSSGNFVFKMEVSRGEGHKPLSIVIESQTLPNGESGLGIRVPGNHGNTTNSQLFQNLETLISHYSVYSIMSDAGGLCLFGPHKASKGKQDKVKKKKPVPFPVGVN